MALSAACVPVEKMKSDEENSPVVATPRAARNGELRIVSDPDNGCQYLLFTSWDGVAMQPRWDGMSRHVGCQVDE